MRRLSVGLAFVLASCATAEPVVPPPAHLPDPISTETDASVSVPTPIDQPVAETPPPEPAPDEAGPAGPGATVAASLLSPGHYATDTRFHQESACSQSWESYSAHGSLVLDLARDGSATACRGRRSSEAGAGFGIRMEEQQGFRGTWRRDGAWLDIELALADDASCPQQRGYTNLEPKPWHLRCARLAPVPGQTSPITQPIVGCQFVDRVYMEELGYAIEGVLDGGWVLLSSGSGLRVVSDQPEPWGEVHFSITPAPTPIGIDAWRAP